MIEDNLRNIIALEVKNERKYIVIKFDEPINYKDQLARVPSPDDKKGMCQNGGNVK